MSSRYDVIRPDTLEEMRRAGHIAKLEARIEKLEAALREIMNMGQSAVPDHWEARSLSREIARKALEGKDD